VALVSDIGTRKQAYSTSLDTEARFALKCSATLDEVQGAAVVQSLHGGLAQLMGVGKTHVKVVTFAAPDSGDGSGNGDSATSQVEILVDGDGAVDKLRGAVPSYVLLGSGVMCTVVAESFRPLASTTPTTTQTSTGTTTATTTVLPTCSADAYMVLASGGSWECVALTVCKASHFVSKAATPTSDRECTMCTVCKLADGVFRAQKCGPDADRRCQKLTTCVDGEFEARTPTISTDRICRQVSCRCLTTHPCTRRQPPHHLYHTPQLTAFPPCASHHQSLSTSTKLRQS
jgi:hypothetical protein